jgi:uncharacterized phage protein
MIKIMDNMENNITCPRCKGTKEDPDYSWKCKTCDATGKISSQKYKALKRISVDLRKKMIEKGFGVCFFIKTKLKFICNRW